MSRHECECSVKNGVHTAECAAKGECMAGVVSESPQPPEPPKILIEEVHTFCLMEKSGSGVSEPISPQPEKCGVCGRGGEAVAKYCRCGTGHREWGPTWFASEEVLNSPEFRWGVHGPTNDERDHVYPKWLMARQDMAEGIAATLNAYEEMCAALRSGVRGEPVPQPADEEERIKMLGEIGLRKLEVNDGVLQMVVTAAPEILALIAECGYQMLEGRVGMGEFPPFGEPAVNYVNIEVLHRPTLARIGFVVQRVGKMTPHEAREKAEAEVASLKAELAALRSGSSVPSRAEVLG